MPGGGTGAYPKAVSGGSGGNGVGVAGQTAEDGGAGSGGTGVTYGGSSSSYTNTNGGYGCGGGGGGLAYMNNFPVYPGTSYYGAVGAPGAPGANISKPGSGIVRIVWGSGRSFPANDVSTTT
jgi:hypothetical protein